MLQMKNNNKNILLGLIFLTTSVTFAQQKLSLKDAISIALQNNYDIRMAKNDAEISNNNFSIGNAGFLPKVDATGSTTRTVTATKQDYNNGQPSVDKSGSGSNAQSASATLTWTLFDGFKMFINYSRLREYKELGDVKLRAQIEESVSSIIKTYYDLVRQKYNYKAAEESISISEQRAKLTEEKYSVGSASKLDVLRAQVDLNTDKSNLLTQEVALNSLKVYMNQLLGRSISTEVDVEDVFDIRSGLSFDETKELSFKNNSDILQIEKTRNISEKDINLSRGDYFPRINLTTGYSYSNSVSDAGLFKTNQNYGYNYGINFSWNLFNGFNTKLQQQNAEITFDKNEIALQQTKAYVESIVVIAFQNYQKNLEILKLEEENVSVAKENVDLAIEQMRLGTISPIEFRDVQKNYVDAQSRLSSAKFNAKVSESDLLKQSGQLLQ
jgi:outer membrane protein